jgi:NCAIR mutase (PurE)-related protein
MKSYKILYLTIIILFSFSCEQKDNSSETDLNCENVKGGIINTDNAIIKTEISKLTTDLNPKPTANDEWGHSANFTTLITRLNACNQITAVSVCYACIKTLPPISEILVKTDSAGVQVQRYLDLKTSAESNLEIIAIHN